MPRVSVLIPVYDAMPWLAIAVGSVLTQTFTDYELLLVDDGSADGSGDWCDALAARDARVRVLRHPGGVNRGQVPSMNLGLAEARGVYLARLDADDMMYPTRLEKQVATLDAHPRVALVGSQFDCAFPTGTTRWRTPTEPHLARWTLLVENCFMHGGVTFRTEAVRALGGYDAAFAPAEDYDLWLRLAEQHEVVSLAETLAWFNRLLGTNISAVQSDHQGAMVLALAGRAIREYLPGVTHEQIRDLLYILHGWPWPDTPARPERLRRLAQLARLVVGLHDAFVQRHNISAEARAAIRDDLNRRLMQIRLAFSSAGGIGHLGRLCRPRWDRQARLLQLPALLSR